ncbi:MAG: Fe-S cluster assembly protein SufD [Elusimicrobiota bacterium]|jgi:Fe-S cluster assembly protein SufD
MNSATALEDVRREARERFSRSTAPAKHLESWRRTDFSRWSLDGAAARMQEPFSPQDAERVAKAGGVLCTLEEAAARFPEQVLPSLSLRAEEAFSRMEAANLSSWRTGAFLRVPKGVKLAEPVTIRFARADKGAAFSRSLVILEEGAQAQLVEEHGSPSVQGQEDCSAAFSSMQLAADAKLRCFYLQDAGAEESHFWHQTARLGRGAHLEHCSLLLGGAVHKSALDVGLAEEGARSDIRAVLLGRGAQRFDTETRQRHLAPRTQSELLFRAALGASSRSVFTGLLRIEEIAKGSEAYQSSRGLMLSDEARANATPILEILTDDVHCKHGAAVGPLDMDQLFYLASRGMSDAEAARLLVMGFFEPVLSRFPDAALAERLARRIEAAL